MQQREASSAILYRIGSQVTRSARPWRERSIFCRADDEVELAVTGGKGYDGDAEGGFVIVEVKLLKRASLCEHQHRMKS